VKSKRRWRRKKGKKEKRRGRGCEVWRKESRQRNENEID
jgi:hypothetical protein